MCFSFVVRKVRNSAARKLKRGQKRKRWGRWRGEKTVTKKHLLPSSPPSPPLPIIDRYTVRSLRASSPIEPRECLRKGLSLPQPPLSRLFSRASRASTFHDIPQMESLLAGKKVRSKTWLSMGCSTIFGGKFCSDRKDFEGLAREQALLFGQAK